MTLKNLYEDVSAQLREGTLDVPELEARWLIAHYLKISETSLWSEPNKEVPENAREIIHSAVGRRLKGEPLAYIIGHKDFYGRTFEVTPDVLIPRPETELLVEEALNFCKGQNVHRVVDLGTGSGCIGISILCESPASELIAVDVSQEALNVADRNARKHGVAERTNLLLCDLQTVESLPNVRDADLIVANPPYIAEKDPDIDDNVRKFEPHHALFSADEGFAHITQWAKISALSLRPGGLYLCEIGSKQADKARKIIEDLGKFEEIGILSDLAGRDRVIRAVRSRQT